MESLSSGVLLNLIHAMEASSASDDEAYPGGAADRRPALLQVTSIIPALVGTGLFPDRGFYLRVSDASHSTYVSLPQDHDDLILSDRLQIGQLIRVARLDSASPVPVLRGLRLLPARLPCPTDTLNIVPTITADPTATFLPPLPQPERKKRQPQSPNGSKDGGRLRSRSIPTSPVNRTVKRQELERGRSDVLSELAKISVTVVDEDSDDSDGSRFSCTSSSYSSRILRPKVLRKSWDATGRRRDTKPLVRNRSASVSPNKFAQRVNYMPKDDTSADMLARKRDTESALKVLGSSPNRKFSVSNKTLLENSFTRIPFSPFNDIKWPENNVVWASLPSSLVKNGKDVLRRRDSVLNAAVDALEEAFALEKLIQSLSIYSEIKSNMEVDPQHLVERFLNFHHDFVQARLITRSLAKLGPLRTCSCSSAGSTSTRTAIKIALERKRCAALWVKAALESDLSRFPNPENTMTDSTEESMADRKFPNPDTCHRLKCTCILNKERKNSDLLPKASDLADALQCECNRWFLKYIEKFLDTVQSEVDNTGCEPRIASLLCLLKKVDEWLDAISSKDRAWASDRCKDNMSLEDEEAEACGRVRKKIYSLLLRHVESAASALVSMNSTEDEKDQGRMFKEEVLGTD